MEETEYSAEQAKLFLEKKFTEQGDFLQIISVMDLRKLVETAMSLDESYMQESGANDGAVYDDDAAYDYMYERMCTAFPDLKMYIMRFVEDYMDFNEQYLESIGAIEWE